MLSAAAFRASIVGAPYVAALCASIVWRHCVAAPFGSVVSRHRLDALCGGIVWQHAWKYRACTLWKRRAEALRERIVGKHCGSVCVGTLCASIVYKNCVGAARGSILLQRYVEALCDAIAFYEAILDDICVGSFRCTTSGAQSGCYFCWFLSFGQLEGF